MSSGVLGTVTFVIDNAVVNGPDMEAVIDQYIKPIMMYFKDCAKADEDSEYSQPSYSFIAYRNMATEGWNSKVGKSLGPFDSAGQFFKALRRLNISDDHLHVFGNVTVALCFLLSSCEQFGYMSEDSEQEQHIILISGTSLNEDLSRTREELARELGRRIGHFSVITLKPNPDVYAMFVEAAGNGPVTVDNAARHPTHMALLKGMNVKQVMAYTEKDFVGAFFE